MKQGSAGEECDAHLTFPEEGKERCMEGENGVVTENDLFINCLQDS